MERSANRGEVVVGTTVGFGKAATVFAALGVLLVGCGAGPVSWNRAVETELAAALPAVAQPILSAAPAKEKAPSSGLVLAASMVTFGGFATRAASDPTAFGYTTTPVNTNIYYSTLFEDGFGMCGSWVMSGPATSAAALGDSFITLGLDYQVFPGKTVGDAATPVAVDDMVHLGIWSDVKTMLNKPGSRSYFKPYVRYGVGLIRMSAVNAGGAPLYNESLQVGFRAGLGVDFKILGLTFFGDFGPQVINSPQESSSSVGGTESMMTMPLRIGLSLVF